MPWELELLGDSAGMVSFICLGVEDTMVHSEIKYNKLAYILANLLTVIATTVDLDLVSTRAAVGSTIKKLCVLTIWAIIGLKNKG